MSALVVAAGSAAIAVLGGFAEAPEKPPPAVRPGEEVDQDLFRTKVVDAVVRTLPAEDAGGAGGLGSGDPHTVLDLTLRVYNTASSSVPIAYLERALLRVAPPQGRPLIEPPPGPGAKPSATPSAGPGEPAWRHDMFIPQQGVDSRLLPPRLTSTVVVRFPVRDGLTPPDRLTIDLGKYELHEDWFTKRTRPELVVGPGDEKLVAARVTLPVKRGEG